MQKKFNVHLKELSRANKVFMYNMYMGGDADTEHDEEIELKGITFQNWEENFSIIENEIKKYELLNQALEDTDATYADVFEKYGEETANLWEDAPYDPQSDFSIKCAFDYMYIILYNEKGDRYHSDRLVSRNY